MSFCIYKKKKKIKLNVRKNTTDREAESLRENTQIISEQDLFRGGHCSLAS